MVSLTKFTPTAGDKQHTARPNESCVHTDIGEYTLERQLTVGLVEGGVAWTHYWGGKHVAANLFGAPVAGAGVGLGNIAFLSWFQFGGGKELYDRLWDEMGVNVKGFMLQPVGPEALGWFPKPIRSMDDFRQMRFRAPPGMVGAAYAEVGVPAVAMGGGDILPALEKGTIDYDEFRLRQARHGHIRKVEPAARARDLEGLGLAEVAEADDLRRRRRRECPEQAAPHDPMGLLSSVAARAASECSEVGLVEATSGRLVARTPCNASQSQSKWR